MIPLEGAGSIDPRTVGFPSFSVDTMTFPPEIARSPTRSQPGRSVDRRGELDFDYTARAGTRNA